jgi:hypothetical protein
LPLRGLEGFAPMVTVLPQVGELGAHVGELIPEQLDELVGGCALLRGRLLSGCGGR